MTVDFTLAVLSEKILNNLLFEKETLNNIIKINIDEKIYKIHVC
jgi:hypothetical protein